MRRPVLWAALLLALLAPGLGRATAELGAFSCERPRPWEPGALVNVSVAASLIDGQSLAPGQVFSFNACMDQGLDRFVDGTSYEAGRKVTSNGGGICQVSSCLYNAVLLSGLEVLERANHSLYDPAEAYVPAGRDAMVTRQGHSDFKFRNSTAAPLSIRAWAQGGKVSVQLLGRQRRPRRRWLETVLIRRDPMAVRSVEDGALAPGERRRLREGFDGLKVESRLCWSGPGGLTQCATLAVDEYQKVDERWAEGPAQGGKP
ncbi:MAG TPA: VanW family protein [bacterium]|jgi:vancomycin resistance protein YoaR|nr:VanW family protein [bacterium]